MQPNTAMTVHTERRKEHRKRPPNLVYVELASANGGMMRDICEEGFAVRVMLPLRPGDSTPFAFSLDESTRFEGRCQVLWVEEAGRVAGLKFTEVSPQLRKQVQLWLSGGQSQTAGESASSAAPPKPANTLEELREEVRAMTPRMEIPRAEEPAPQAPPVELPPEEKSVPQPLPPMEIVATAPESESPVVADDSPIVEAPQIAAPAVEEQVLEPLPELVEESQEVEFPASPRWLDRVTVSLAVLILVFLALVAGSIVYHRELGLGLIWLGTKISGAQVVPAPQVPGNDSPVQTAPSSTSSALDPDGAQTASQRAGLKEATPAPSNPGSKKASESPAVVEHATVEAVKTPNPNSVGPTPAVDKPPVPKPAHALSSEPGQQEFLQAQEILKNKNREGAMPEAARLLWIAVEKGNSGAEIALAELYWHGQGLSRNCDQARILLTAAARKGNAEGKKQLEQFQREGCE